MPTVFKFGSLNLLENSGHVQACRGNALPPPPTVGSAEHLYVHSPTDHTEDRVCQVELH